MNRNSTLLFIEDGYGDKSEFYDVYEMLDPKGEISRELEEVFKNVEYCPRIELISKILSNT